MPRLNQVLLTPKLLPRRRNPPSPLRRLSESSDEAPKKRKPAADKKAVESPSDEEQEALPKKRKSAAGKTDDEAPKKPAAKKAAMKVAFDRSTKKWMVEGTDYYIESSKNRVIVGKLLDKKELPLSQSDVRACEDKGWKVSSIEDDDGTISE